MGSPLGSIYSAIDSQKRRLIDALRNPRLAAEQAVGRANDDARALNEMTAAAAQEGLKYGPASEALAMKLADAYNPAGITVWHGSPHKFDRFNASKIGTGEGAQAYGHGIYTAEAKDVAKSYAVPRGVPDIEAIGTKHGLSLADRDMRIELMRQAAANSDAAKAAQGLQYANIKARNESPAKLQAVIDEWNNAKNATSLYKVDLPDEHVARMLDWDRPFSQQAPAVKKALQDAGVVGKDDWLISGMRGREIYNRASIGAPAKLPLNQADDQIFAAERLRNAGIPGIRYLDGGSRGAGQGTSNFVVFPGNEDMLQILERNGQPVIDALRKRK